MSPNPKASCKILSEALLHLKKKNKKKNGTTDSARIRLAAVTQAAHIKWGHQWHENVSST